MAIRLAAKCLRRFAFLWERRFGAPIYPRSRQRGAWHRLCRCSRINPLLQRLKRYTKAFDSRITGFGAVELRPVGNLLAVEPQAEAQAFDTHVGFAALLQLLA